MLHRGNVIRDKRLIRDTEQRAWVLNELKHATGPDKPAPLQLGCLRVPVFACPLCHEMEGVGDCVRVETQIPFVFKGMLVTEVLCNVHADFDPLLSTGSWMHFYISSWKDHKRLCLLSGTSIVKHLFHFWLLRIICSPQHSSLKLVKTLFDSVLNQIINWVSTEKAADPEFCFHSVVWFRLMLPNTVN